MVACFGFVLLHLGIAATMTVGLFSYAAIAVWMALLPGEWWDRWTPFQLHSLSDLAANRPSPRARRLARRFAASLCLGALLLVIYWNVANEVSRRAVNSFDRSMRIACHVTGLRQAWGVFGNPPRKDSWFVYQARLQNGELVDLLSGGDEILDNKPALASRQFANHRWRKLHLRLRSDSGEPYRQALASYMCREWNAAHGPDEQVVRLDFYCYTQAFDLAGNPGDHARMTLAQVVGEEGGNFAEALRSGEEF
jgi:hypothetical protein